MAVPALVCSVHGHDSINASVGTVNDVCLSGTHQEHQSAEGINILLVDVEESAPKHEKKSSQHVTGSSSVFRSQINLCV